MEIEFFPFQVKHHKLILPKCVGLFHSCCVGVYQKLCFVTTVPLRTMMGLIAVETSALQASVSTTVGIF